MGERRIRVITGHYGSGKSEFSVNYAIKVRGEVEGKLALSDLDVINVYFRSRERKEELEKLGIHVIASSVDAPTLDVPALSAEIHTPLLNKDYVNIIDLGGDDTGAKVLARYSDMIDKDELDMFFVINANREKTQNAQEVISYIKSIEKTSGFPVTGLINNTHMLKHTTLEDVEKGQQVCREVSKELNIPIKYISCIESVAKEIPADFEGEVLIVKLLLRDDWMM